MRGGGAIAQAVACCVGAAGVLAAALVVASSSPAATTVPRAGAPPGSPALDRMALGVADLVAGGSIRRQGYVMNRNFTAYYVREFKQGASLGATQLSELESDVGLATSTVDATRVAARTSAALRSKSRRLLFVKGVLRDSGWDSTGARVVFGGLRRLVAGDAAFSASMTAVLRGGLRLSIAVELVRVERAVQLLYVLGAPNTTVVPDEAVRLVELVAARMVAGLSPLNVAVPIISGLPQEGQTLTADVGSWANSPTSFAYRWLRCDAAGGGCIPIEGATSTTYLLPAVDIGSMLELSVVATNAVGPSAPAVSAPTAVVAAATPPP